MYSLSSYNLTPDQVERVIDAYMGGLHVIFIMFTPILAVCCACALLIQDHGVAEKDAKPPQQKSLQDEQRQLEAQQKHEVGSVVPSEQQHVVQNEKIAAQ